MVPNLTTIEHLSHAPVYKILIKQRYYYFIKQHSGTHFVIKCIQGRSLRQVWVGWHRAGHRKKLKQARSKFIYKYSKKSYIFKSLSTFWKRIALLWMINLRVHFILSLPRDTFPLLSLGEWSREFFTVGLSRTISAMTNYDCVWPRKLVLSSGEHGIKSLLTNPLEPAHNRWKYYIINS
jgi:hypothetical protein